VFIADYLEGMTQGAQDHGFKLEAYSFKHTDIDDIIRNTFNDDSTAGLIVLATELNEQDMQHFSEASFPVVFIDNYNEFLPFDFVDMDNSSSIHMAYDYVRSCGFTQIGFISSYTDTNNFKMRERAYRIITDQETHIIQVESTFDGAYQDISNFLSNAENEVMPVYLCANDIMALGAMKAFKEHGYSLPDDVSLIGFDNLPQTQHVDPPLTTIAVSKRRIARIAVQQLKNHIEDPSAPTVRTLVGGRLIIRDSLKKQHQTPNIFSQA
jgi:LacI family transcriptional regulator